MFHDSPSFMYCNLCCYDAFAMITLNLQARRISITMHLGLNSVKNGYAIHLTFRAQSQLINVTHDMLRYHDVVIRRLCTQAQRFDLENWSSKIREEYSRLKFRVSKLKTSPLCITLYSVHSILILLCYREHLLTIT